MKDLLIFLKSAVAACTHNGIPPSIYIYDNFKFLFVDVNTGYSVHNRELYDPGIPFPVNYPANLYGGDLYTIHWTKVSNFYAHINNGMK